MRLEEPGPSHLGVPAARLRRPAPAPNPGADRPSASSTARASWRSRASTHGGAQGRRDLHSAGRGARDPQYRHGRPALHRGDLTGRRAGGGGKDPAAARRQHEFPRALGQPEIYGTTTAAELDAMLLAHAQTHGYQLEMSSIRTSKATRSGACIARWTKACKAW
ncbi:MAG: hypothetical protein MZW92_77895 [Comamonadaceae bacterium]|nr:hypothetical protein [Comamonadaceae bacterium]